MYCTFADATGKNTIKPISFDSKQSKPGYIETTVHVN